MGLWVCHLFALPVLILSHIEETPQDTQRLIGLGYPELQQLIQNAERLHNEKQAVLLSQKTRIIAGGGGRKSKMSVPEQIILTLVYLRHMTTFQLLRRMAEINGRPLTGVSSGTQQICGVVGLPFICAPGT